MKSSTWVSVLLSVSSRSFSLSHKHQKETRSDSRIYRRSNELMVKKKDEIWSSDIVGNSIGTKIHNGKIETQSRNIGSDGYNEMLPSASKLLPSATENKSSTYMRLLKHISLFFTERKKGKKKINPNTTKCNGKKKRKQHESKITNSGKTVETPKRTKSTRSKPSHAPSKQHIFDSAMISVDKRIYNVGDEITIAFYNIDAKSDDWVGIYAAGTRSDTLIPPRCLMWLYACGTQKCRRATTSGKLVFGVGAVHENSRENWPLSAGGYEAFLARNNSPMFSIIIASPKFQVIKPKFWSEPLPSPLSANALRPSLTPSNYSPSPEVPKFKHTVTSPWSSDQALPPWSYPKPSSTVYYSTLPLAIPSVKTIRKPLAPSYNAPSTVAHSTKIPSVRPSHPSSSTKPSKVPYPSEIPTFRPIMMSPSSQTSKSIQKGYSVLVPTFTMELSLDSISSTLGDELLNITSIFLTEAMEDTYKGEFKSVLLVLSLEDQGNRILEPLQNQFEATFNGNVYMHDGENSPQSDELQTNMEEAFGTDKFIIFLRSSENDALSGVSNVKIFFGINADDNFDPGGHHKRPKIPQNSISSFENEPAQLDNLTVILWAVTTVSALLVIFLLFAAMKKYRSQNESFSSRSSTFSAKTDQNASSIDSRPDGIMYRDKDCFTGIDKSKSSTKREMNTTGQNDDTIIQKQWPPFITPNPKNTSRKWSKKSVNACEKDETVLYTFENVNNGMGIDDPDVVGGTMYF